MSTVRVWTAILAAAIVFVWGVDRLALCAEARGWIYYRKSKRQTGSNLGDAFLEIHEIYVYSLPGP